MNVKVSVIIPIYNVEQYLIRCVESVMSQSYSHLEIILVDDGSPDKCPEICDLLSREDARIKVIHKENGGLSSARNAGLDVATGDYIAFVDSDDYIDKSMIEIMIVAVEKYGVPVACCGRVRVSNTNQNLMFNLPKEKVLTGEQAIKEVLLGGCVEEAAWDKLYKADIFKNRRFPLGEINEDVVQTIEILGACKSIVHVGKPLYYYCENIGSITQNGYDRRKTSIIKHLDQIRKYLEKEYPKLNNYVSVLETRYCQSALYLLLDNRNVIKHYYQDYQMFYKRFRNNFLKAFVRKHIKKSELIKGWLIFLEIYYPLHSFKKRICK